MQSLTTLCVASFSKPHLQLKSLFPISSSHFKTTSRKVKHPRLNKNIYFNCLKVKSFKDEKYNFGLN